MSGISPTFSSSLKAFFPTDSTSEHSILQEALYKWLDMKWYILQQAQKLHACLLILEVKLSQVLLCAYANAENNVTDDLFQMDSMELLKYFCNYPTCVQVTNGKFVADLSFYRLVHLLT